MFGLRFSFIINFHVFYEDPFKSAFALVNHSIDITVHTNITESELRPRPSGTGLRPEPGLEQLESVEQIDSFGYLDCGDYLESIVRERTLSNFDHISR